MMITYELSRLSLGICVELKDVPDNIPFYFIPKKNEVWIRVKNVLYHRIAEDRRECCSAKPYLSLKVMTI